MNIRELGKNTPKCCNFGLESYQTMFEGAYKPNSRIFAIFGMCFDEIVSGCLHWIFQWSHRKAYKIKELCVTYMYIRRISFKKEKPRISVSISYTLLLRITRWHNIHFLLFRFDEWDRLLRSLNIHIFAFPISLSMRKLWWIVSH